MTLRRTEHKEKEEIGDTTASSRHYSTFTADNIVQRKLRHVAIITGVLAPPRKSGDAVTFLPSHHYFLFSLSSFLPSFIYLFCLLIPSFLPLCIYFFIPPPISTLLLSLSLSLSEKSLTAQCLFTSELLVYFSCPPNLPSPFPLASPVGTST